MKCIGLYYMALLQRVRIARNADRCTR